MFLFQHLKIGKSGIKVEGLSEQQAAKLQRFGHAHFVTTKNEQVIVEELVQDRAKKLNGLDLIDLYSKTGNILNDVNEDTIGFFIAKFKKST